MIDILFCEVCQQVVGAEGRAHHLSGRCAENMTLRKLKLGAANVDLYTQEPAAPSKAREWRERVDDEMLSLHHDYNLARGYGKIKALHDEAVSLIEAAEREAEEEGREVELTLRNLDKTMTERDAAIRERDEARRQLRDAEAAKHEHAAGRIGDMQVAVTLLMDEACAREQEAARAARGKA